MTVHKIISRFAPGTWIESWPHKINLGDHPRILSRLQEMANAELQPVWVDWLKQHMVTRDQKLEWMYSYIHALGNDAFLEVSGEAPDGWVVFGTDDELALFILQHS